MSEQDNKPNTVLPAMLAVMRAVGAIGKTSYNSGQKFNFRGIDDVMNALHGPMCEHGLVVTFKVLSKERETRDTSSGGKMNVVHLVVAYTFHGPGGDTLTTEAPGEAQDSGDKATNKALSAAFKYALLHGFCIPTQDMEDADGSHVEAAPAARQNASKPHPARATNPEVIVPSPAVAQKLSAINSCREQLGWTHQAVRELAADMKLPARSTDFTAEQAGQLLAVLEARLGELATI
jgi:hypothetical protein